MDGKDFSSPHAKYRDRRRPHGRDPACFLSEGGQRKKHYTPREIEQRVEDCAAAKTRGHRDLEDVSVFQDRL